MSTVEGMQYNIENIAINTEKRKLVVCINGWFYDSDRHVEVVNNKGKLCKANVVYFYREDVNQYLELADSSNNGFVISVPWKKEDSLTVKLSSGDQQVEYYATNLCELVEQYRAEHGWRAYINRENFDKAINYLKKYGVIQTIKRIFEKFRGELTVQEERVVPYTYDYSFVDETIPMEWIKIQKFQPTFAVLVNVDNWKAEYKLGWNSLNRQSYENYKVVIKTIEAQKSTVISKIKNSGTKNFVQVVTAFEEAELDKVDYFVPFDLQDELSINTLAYLVEVINDKMKPDIVYGDYDFFEQEGKYHTRIKKANIPSEKVTQNVICRGVYAVKKGIGEDQDINNVVADCLNANRENNQLCNRVVHVDRLLVHRRIVAEENVTPMKAIAFYLPQFHTFPENDEWWGKGFTEWTNVTRGIPMFEGHNQPRIPSTLGYYNLVDDKGIQEKQAVLAKEHNVHGFCYYHYWFNGKRLMEKPVNYLLAHKEIDQPFCICWANENWTRTWDGLNKDILIEQIYEPDSDERFIRDIIDIISDERYIRINNRPLLLVYKIALLHDGKKAIEKWREVVKEYGMEGLYVAIVKQLGVENAEQFGADAVVEFPPHDMNVNNITETVKGLNEDFAGGIYDYSELANRDLATYDYTIFRSCMLQWDNTARRMERASIFHNFSPEDYKRWLLRCKEYELLFNDSSEQFVFINAWNEWAEGTCLEPDEKYGDSFLKITKQILESR